MKNGDPVFPRTFFPDFEDTGGRQLPAWLFAFSVIALFVIIHFPADMLPNVAGILRLGANAPAWIQQEKLVENVWIPVKGIAFRISVFFLALPFAVSFYRFLRSLEPRRLWKTFGLSLLVFIILGILCFPYQNGSGLSSMGNDYGMISSNPFAVKSGFFYRRLLMPGLSYVLGFCGTYWYYIFTLVVTWFLVFLTTLALGLWLSSDSDSALTATGKYDNWTSLAIISAATSSYIAFQYQFPGYPEQLGHAIILIMAIVPMRSQTRWAGVALALASHDLMIFVLLPVIVFFFRPFKERAVALAIVGLYGFFWLAAYRFHPFSLVSVHTDLAPSVNTIDIFFNQWRWVIVGALAAYKVFWVLFVWALLYLLWRSRFYSALALAGLLLTPLATLVVATDTSRLAGLGFLGALLALAILWRSIESTRERYLIRGMLILNILVPSVYIPANYNRIPRAGLYEIVINYISGY
jgi:hypothetical protein